MTPAQHDAARTGHDTTRHDDVATRHDTTRHDRTGPDRTGPERRSRAATAAAAAAAARGVDGGAAAPGGGGGDTLWCACSEINHQKKIVKKKTDPYTAAVGHAACLFVFLNVLGRRVLRRNCAP